MTRMYCNIYYNHFFFYDHIRLNSLYIFTNFTKVFPMIAIFGFVKTTGRFRSSLRNIPQIWIGPYDVGCNITITVNIMKYPQHEALFDTLLSYCKYHTRRRRINTTQFIFLQDLQSTILLVCSYLDGDLCISICIYW